MTQFFLFPKTFLIFESFNGLFDFFIFATNLCLLKSENRWARNKTKRDEKQDN
ncbi:hypothetical protein NC99_28420 [Sunxiuqinia dokdonensis]|uniref:Uncharacterized protein n=1 Tax=Sunxiuqinia dokdonensis TaxID=1409788 RepID=A0A0L8V7D5_9BACT|nr:hypothetical protein NC99_28420 [Sunxiuqinia dokdonensis]